MQNISKHISYIKSYFNIINVSVIKENRYFFYKKNICLNKKEALYIKGKNGSGKTTLLRLAIGLKKFHEGSILWYNSYSHTRMFFLPNDSNLNFKDITLIPIIYEQTSHLKFLVNLLSKHINEKFEKLSTGEKKITQLSNLIIYPSPIWLLDEPESNLDEINQLKLKLAINLHLKNMGILFITTHKQNLYKYSIYL
uniref:Cytochrome c1 ABC transporter ATP-binding subunit n=1 Tax=Cyanidiococcus yangmingshanensis TaxID=2690220 RepID=A0A7H0WBF0_9RHOD|nr:cytochrome c1 ABC transporter ATP-binding subunit [Cyanidiococcus yangmingshanensis]UNJ18943.1 cytochrome c1 ABC transporter ATP-binding subunit [Cyanidioschyzonaceae sp. 2 FvB-2021]